MNKPEFSSINVLIILIICIAALRIMFSCASGQANSGTSGHRPTIREIEFSGVKRFEKDELLEYMYMDETSFWEWTGLADRYHYSRGVALEDEKRIVSLYQSFGYYDAAVRGMQTEPLNEEGTELKVIIEVEEGEPVLIESISFSWPKGEVDREEIESKIHLEAGKVFETGKLNESAIDIRLALQEKGYASAAVRERAEIIKENRTASVYFTVIPGPFCTIGEIRFEGLDQVPQHLVENEIDFAPGHTYSPTLLNRMEKAIYAMDVFDSVSVIPDAEPGKDGRLALTVRVSESRPQRIKTGPGIGIEPNRWEARVSARYTHTNLFGDLVRLDVRAAAGYAVMPYPWDINEHGPVFRLMPTLTRKGWLEPKLIWTIKPSFELGVEEGYQYYTPKLRFGVSRFLFGFTLLEASYNIHFFDFFDQSSIIEQNKTLLGLDYRDPYILSYLELGYWLYFTDEIFEPRNGAVLGAVWDAAGTIVGGHYDYHKVTPEVRAYWEVFSHLQVAARAQTGFIFPYAWTPGAPISEKYYLGGSGTVRGWGPKRLSPRIEQCDENGDCRSLPIGGYTMVLGNLELRFRTIEQLFLVPFVDLGDVQPGEVQYEPGQWSCSAGGGIRWASPIGKFRLDFGYRVNNPERFRDEQRWGIHFSLGETF